MRDFKGMKRQRGRNRGGGGGPQSGGGKPQHNINRAFDSNGPDNIKVRGNAQHVYEKYQALARDAALAGDRVLGENHLQHAEHYFRTLRAIQPTRAASEIVSRDTSSNGDIDFEDEAVETAMEEADAQAAARLADAQNAPQGAVAEGLDGSSEPQRFDRDQGQGQRPWRDRPQGEFRDRPFNDRDRQDRQPPQGEFRDRQTFDRQNSDRQNPDRQNSDRQNGERQGGQPQGEFRGQDRPRHRDRDDRFRDRQDRPQGDAGGDRQDRPQGEFRSDRQGGANPAPFAQQAGQGQAGQPGEARDRQDRGDRPRFREREDRRPDPREGDAASAPAEAAAAPEAAAPEPVRDEARPVLRSEDGGVSQLPGFLQPATAPTAPASAEEGERPRRPRRRRTREDGDAAPAAPEVEQA